MVLLTTLLEQLKEGPSNSYVYVQLGPHGEAIGRGRPAKVVAAANFASDGGSDGL